MDAVQFYRNQCAPAKDRNANPAWEITKGDQNIIIAILDTGVDVNHLDLLVKLLEGYNVYDVGHGTRVAGAAMAITNNMIGVSAPVGTTKFYQ